jgi:Rhomboid family
VDPTGPASTDRPAAGRSPDGHAGSADHPDVPVRRLLDLLLVDVVGGDRHLADVVEQIVEQDLGRKHQHILGNTLFLAVFGKNVNAAFGHLRYLVFYIAGGFVAFMIQTAMTLLFAPAAAARVPNLGASGANAAVMGAYIVLYPEARSLTLVLVFPVKIPAWVFLGVWFPYQLIEGNFGLFSANANGGGVAFFAHVGGFIFGVIVRRCLVQAGSVPDAAPSRMSSDSRL